MSVFMTHSDRNFSSTSANNKPRHKAGLCDTVQDRAFGQKKRVRRFERPTCTLATCKPATMGACLGTASQEDHRLRRTAFNHAARDTSVIGEILYWYASFHGPLPHS